MPDFRKLWFAQFVSVFGDFLALFGVISLITFRWHGNVMQVTWVSIAYMVPLALVGPVAGVFVDRWNVKRVMVASDLIRAFLALLLVWTTDVRQICAILFAISTVSSFFAPSQSVTVRTLIPVDKLLAANALMSQAFYTVRLVSPAAAGALISAMSERACFVLDAASFAFSGLMILTITIDRKPAAASGKTMKGFLTDFTSGNRFIFTHPSLAFVISSMVAAMFVMSCFSPLISIYVRDALLASSKRGPLLFGIVSSMVGVGLILGTQVINRLGHGRSKKDIVLAGLLVASCAVGLLAAFRNFIGASSATFLMGIGFSFVIVSAQTLMQQETPREMIGRVSSSFMSLFSVAQVLGLLVSGRLAKFIGVRPTFALCALVLFGLVVMGKWRLKATTPAAAMAD